MKKNLFNFFGGSDKFFLFPFLIALSSIIFITSLYLFYYHQLPARLPLFYSLPWGEEQLVDRQQFFILPTVLLLITLINSFLAFQLHSLQFISKRILMFSLIIISLITLATALKILFIFI